MLVGFIIGWTAVYDIIILCIVQIRKPMNRREKNAYKFDVAKTKTSMNRKKRKQIIVTTWDGIKTQPIQKYYSIICLTWWKTSNVTVDLQLMQMILFFFFSCCFVWICQIKLKSELASGHTRVVKCLRWLIVIVTIGTMPFDCKTENIIMTPVWVCVKWNINVYFGISLDYWISKHVVS